MANDAAIYDALFVEAFKEAQNKYRDVEINEEKARALIFYILEQRQSGDGRSYQQIKTAWLDEMSFGGRARSALHSLTTRYFKKLAGRKKNKKAADDNRAIIWKEILLLCKEEQDGLRYSRNEHIIDPDGKDNDFCPDL